MSPEVQPLIAGAVFLGLLVGFLWLRSAWAARGKPAGATSAAPPKTTRPAKVTTGSPEPSVEDAGYRAPAQQDPRVAPPNVVGLRLRIGDLVDGPEELEGQLPLICEHVRRLPGRDRPDYDLFALETPIVWDGRRVEHLVIAPRTVGARLGKGMRNMMVGIALARDERLAAATELDFAHAESVAMGLATSIDT